MGSAAAYCRGFGSVARGDGTADSDIDLLLVRRRGKGIEDDAWQGQVSRLREEVTSWTGNVLQVYDIGSDDMERSISARDPLVGEWRADAITVRRTDLRGLLRDLGHRVAGCPRVQVAAPQPCGKAEARTRLAHAPPRGGHTSGWRCRGGYGDGQRSGRLLDIKDNAQFGALFVSAKVAAQSAKWGRRMVIAAETVVLG